MLLLLGTYDTVWVSKSGVPNLNSFNGPQTDHKPSLFLLPSSFYISIPADKQTKFTLQKMHWLYITYPSVCVCVYYIYTLIRGQKNNQVILLNVSKWKQLWTLWKWEVKYLCNFRCAEGYIRQKNDYAGVSYTGLYTSTRGAELRRTLQRMHTASEIWNVVISETSNNKALHL